MEQGLIHIYCGNGKGKTTACLGLTIRCAGHGNKVLFVQFLKSRPTGELNSLELLPNIEVLRGKETKKFTFQMTAEEKQEVLREHEQLFTRIKTKLTQENVQLLVLDEIIGACNTGVFDENQLLDFLKTKPQRLEVVLSGRDPSPELLELADYVSEICKRKHPFDKGIPARSGIEK
ncbi:cob(I)yrinic acid a,c-diamide adenosyltransferase [uncultured Phascolarctobacterium sp.]|uniref:cob(I)yrinic acid a,c-diamide adenosyltransferase n=1 Tax=uncultured Phascolarctobacterium sp. TaxID=512296 RepID=UPI0027D97960|nr:cob(I)yrinic acid a,c-diamide adenosyltransferase [uncultured Phascolarctobacterium sp.]